MRVDYSEITEQRSDLATQEQLERLYHRYHFASAFSKGRSVLEVGCGCGLGLGYLAKSASSVVGGDIDSRNVALAERYYQGNECVSVVMLDAHNLPFDDGSFDLVLLFESIYYLEKPEVFIREAHRVLNESGVLLICSVNKDWRDFHPSRYSVRYFGVSELSDLLSQFFPDVRCYGAFEAYDLRLKARALSFLKRTASKLNLIPGSLKAREFLKRIFLGKLMPIPNEIYEGMTEYRVPIEIARDSPTDRYKIIYAVASKGKGNTSDDNSEG